VLKTLKFIFNPSLVKNKLTLAREISILYIRTRLDHKKITQNFKG